MAGAIIMVVLLVVVFPVAILMSGAVLAATLGGVVKQEADARNTNDDGTPNEYLAVSEADGQG